MRRFNKPTAENGVLAARALSLRMAVQDTLRLLQGTPDPERARRLAITRLQQEDPT